MNKSPKCHVCNKTPFDFTTALTRVNALGTVPAVWACQDHADIPLDDVTKLILEDNKRRSGAPPEAE